MEKDLIVKLLGKDGLTPVLNKATKSLTDFGQKGSRLDDIRKKFEGIQSSSAPLTRKISDIRRAMMDLAASGHGGSELFKEMALQAQDLKRQIKEVDDAMNGISVNGGLKGAFDFKGLANTVGAEMGMGNIGGALSALVTPAGAAAAGIALVGKTFVDAGKAAADFEVHLDQLQSLTGATEEDMKAISEGAIEMSKTFGTSAGEIVDAMGMIGSKAPELLKDKDALMQVTDAANVLAKAGGISVEEAATALTGVMNQMGVSSKECYDIINVLAAGSQQGAGSIEYLNAAFAKAGTNAKGAGMSYVELASAIETVAPKFGNAEVAGTALNGTLLKLSMSGKNEFMPSVVGMSQALENLAKAELSDAEMKKLVGESNVVMLKTLIEGRGQFDSFTASLQGTNTAFEQMEMNTDNLQGYMGRLKATWDAFLITLGQSGFMQGILDNIMLVMNSLGEVIDVIGDVIKEFDSLGADGEENVNILAVQLEIVKDVLIGIGRVLQGVVKVVVAAFGKIKETVQNVSNSIKNKWNEVKNSLNNIAFVRTIMNGFQKVLDTLYKLVAKAKNIWNDFLNWLGVETKSAASSAAPDITSAIETASVEDEEDSSSGGGGKSGSSKKGGGKKTGGTKKTVSPKKVEKVKTQIEIDRDSLKAEKTALQNAMNDFNDGLITRQALEEAVRTANRYFEEHGIKSRVEIEFETDSKGFEKAVEKKLKESKPTIKGVESDKYFAAGSKEDDRLSYQNAQARAEQVQTDLKIGLISEDSAAIAIREINNELEAIGLRPLDLQLNIDTGEFVTATELIQWQLDKTQKELDKQQKKFDETKDAVNGMSDAFGALGSAIGGAAGEWMNFAAQSAKGIQDMISQIRTLIVAKEAESTANAMGEATKAPWFMMPLTIAGLVATVAGIFASLPKFEQGGIVGGTSYTGDRILTRLNSGEMVLNRRQQAGLYSALSGSDTGAASAGEVVFHISGTNLMGVLRNCEKKLKRQG